MKNVEKIIDINAHIENLICEVNVENGTPIAKISFTNLGYGDITAVKFNAVGYNSFGDIVPVNGKDKFFLIIQDMVIAKNETAANLRAKLPSADIRKLDLEECQICYADGSVVSYQGEQRLIFELEQIDQQEQLNALHKLYDEKAVFIPKDYAQGWVCSCGRFNVHEKTVCSLCGKLKSDTEKVCSEENLIKLVEEYRISEEKDREARQEERKKQEKEKTKKKVITGMIAAVCIVLIYLIFHTVQISQRTTYASESEMKKDLEGVWTNYDEDYRASHQIKIKGDSFVIRWIFRLSSARDLELTIDEWNPKEGTFQVSVGTYTILSNGNIKDEDGNEYERGGSWSDNDSETSYSY